MFPIGFRQLFRGKLLNFRRVVGKTAGFPISVGVWHATWFLRPQRICDFFVKPERWSNLGAIFAEVLFVFCFPFDILFGFISICRFLVMCFVKFYTGGG